MWLAQGEALRCVEPERTETAGLRPDAPAPRGREAWKVAVTKLREGRKISSNPEKGAVGMGLDISPQTEARIRQEAQRQGISVDALLECLMNGQAAGTAIGAYQAVELPVLHLGPMGPLHRRDIYDDVR